MSSSFFHDPQVVSDLLAICQGEGWIVPKAREKARILIEHGVHPEQALIGSGLISPDQYGEALTQLFDIPFVRVSPSTSSALRGASVLNKQDLAQQGAQIIDQEGKTLLVAFTDPSDATVIKQVAEMAQSHGLQLVPAVMLWSDMRLKQSSPSPAVSIGSVRRRLYQALDEASASQIEIGTHGDGWQVSHRSVESLPRVWQDLLPSASAALALHLHRHKRPSWEIRHARTSHGSSVELIRTGVMEVHKHPLNWSTLFSSFLQKPSGMLIFINAHQEAEDYAKRHDWGVLDEEAYWRHDPAQPYLYSVDTAEQRELATHAVLSGRPVVARQSDAGVDWLEALATTRIPISIIEQHRVPEGMAWTARRVNT